MKHIEELMKDPIWKAGIMIVTIILSIVMVHSCFGAEIDLRAIEKIESSGDPRAYNEATEARGLYQITPICLRDYNERHKIKYSEEDLFDPEINEKVAEWYLEKRIPQMLRYYDKPVTTKNQIIAYNAGIRYVTQGLPIPYETERYLEKYDYLTGGNNDKEN